MKEHITIFKLYFCDPDINSHTLPPLAPATSHLLLYLGKTESASYPLLSHLPLSWYRDVMSSCSPFPPPVQTLLLASWNCSCTVGFNNKESVFSRTYFISLSPTFILLSITRQSYKIYQVLLKCWRLMKRKFYNRKQKIEYSRLNMVFVIIQGKSIKS